MNKPKLLYHGSATLIEGHINPKKATDETNPENSQEGVYAIDLEDIAKAMSLRDKCIRHSMMDYSSPEHKLICIDGTPDPNSPHYVYVVSSDGFERTNPGGHQWVSKKPAKIIKRILLTKDEIPKYWRKATGEDIEKK